MDREQSVGNTSSGKIELFFLRNAELSRADLHGARLQGAILPGLVWKESRPQLYFQIERLRKHSPRPVEGNVNTPVADIIRSSASLASKRTRIELRWPSICHLSP
ncbi:MAG: pentapeptide repeat-containing protein [Nitrospira sp.]|nr:pentapeptide repeat-containing protein [Nitrospira sp.]